MQSSYFVNSAERAVRCGLFLKSMRAMQLHIMCWVSGRLSTKQGALFETLNGKLA